MSKGQRETERIPPGAVRELEKWDSPEAGLYPKRACIHSPDVGLELMNP